MFLLDTDHCSHVIERNPIILQRFETASNEYWAISVIARGELLYMAEKSDRCEENLVRVQGFLNSIDVLLIDDVTSERYAELKAALMRKFGPKERAARRGFTIQEIGIHDNDLWIAASALRNGLTLVSRDSDFRRISDAYALPIESWLMSTEG